MTRKELIVVDIQNDYFPGGKWPLAGADAAADNAARVVASARAAGDLVVHIRHEFTSADAPFFIAGSEGARIHPKVLNRPDEQVVLKHYVNSFRETDLKQILDAGGIEELTVVGSMSHMCIQCVLAGGLDRFGLTIMDLVRRHQAGAGLPKQTERHGDDEAHEEEDRKDAVVGRGVGAAGTLDVPAFRARDCVGHALLCVPGHS